MGIVLSFGQFLSSNFCEVRENVYRLQTFLNDVAILDESRPPPTRRSRMPNSSVGKAISPRDNDTEKYASLKKTTPNTIIIAPKVTHTPNMNQYRADFMGPSCNYSVLSSFAVSSGVTEIV